MTDKPFLFKGIYYANQYDTYCLLSNNTVIENSDTISGKARSGISYVRGYYDRTLHTFKSSTRRLSQSELQDLALNRLNINSLDSNLMKAKE
jgi:hypothetical protein